MMCLVASMMDGDGFVTYLATMLVAVAMSGLVQHARYVSCPITVSSHFCFSWCSTVDVYSSVGISVDCDGKGLRVG